MIRDRSKFQISRIWNQNEQAWGNWQVLYPNGDKLGLPSWEAAKEWSQETYINIYLERRKREQER